MEEFDVKSKGARITAIAGHYGSGKSEISVNYALFLAEKLGPEAQIGLFGAANHGCLLLQFNLTLVTIQIKL